VSARRLILIDLSGIFRAAWHATSDMELSEAYSRTIAKVASLSAGFDLVAICCDWPPYRRKAIHEFYKAHREAPPQAMVEQFRRTKERLKSDGYLLWQVEGYEADDLIATACKLAEPDELDITIASSDKDLLCLVDDARPIRCVSLATGEVFDRMATIAKFGVAPALMPDLLALMGDASDNVPGIPGVGIKTGSKLLETYGNAMNVVECAADIKGKLGEAVRANATGVALALRLVTLETDAPIDWDSLYAERSSSPTQDEEDMEDAQDAEFESSPENTPPPPPPKANGNGSNGNGHAKPEPEEPKAQAIVRVPVDYSQALEPMSMGQAYQLSRGLEKSRLYTRFPSAEAIWAVIIRGREMGLGALTALDSFHVIEGKPAPSAHLIIARAKEHPDCEYFQCLETTGTKATWVTKNRRNPEPTRLTYTLDQAQTAGLLRRGGNWAARPDEMLRKTAGVQLARIEYPGASLGLYCPEEMGADA
jgi:5'-3' exonuclease